MRCYTCASVTVWSCNLSPPLQAPKLSTKATMSDSPSRSDAQVAIPPPQQAESPLSSLVYDMSQQIQMAMENMLKMINEIDQSSAGIMEDIEKNKESVLEKKRFLEEEKNRFQKAAYTVLDMLNNRE